MRFPFGTAGVLAAACLTVAIAVPASGQDVSVRWDQRGVAHVTASTDEGVFFGQGYAMATDRLAQMHLIRMASQGRMAEVVGNPMVASGKRPLDQDREMRWVQLYELMEERVQRLDVQTLSALQAFCDGVNQYVDELSQTLTCAGGSPLLAEPLEGSCAAIVAGTYPEWTPADCLAAWEWWIYWFGSQPYGTDARNLFDSGWAPTEIVPDEDATAIVEADMDAGLLADANTYATTYHNTHVDVCTGLAEGSSPTFSHSWAVGGSSSRSTGAIVVSGPKTSVNSPNMFYEIHAENLDAVAGFNARGICLTGTPGFFQGFNSFVAWGGSALGLDDADLIRVVPDPADPQNRYLYDEDGDGTAESHLFTTRMESIAILGTPPAQWPRVRITSTEFGPVLTDESGLVTDGQGFDYVLRSNLTFDKHEKHTVQSTLGMLHTRTAEAWRESAKYWLSPAIQSVFGDSSGTIGYTPQVALPTRGDPARYAGHVAVFNGDNPDHDWVRTLPYDLLPWSIKEDGELISANQRPAACWYPIPMLLKDSSQRPNFRWLRLWEYLIGPASAIDFDAEDVAAMFFDATHSGRQEVVRLALDLQSNGYTFSSPAQTALGQLAGWYADGAKSEADDPRFAYVAGISLKIPGPNSVPPPPMVDEIVAEYGGATGGAVAMLRTTIEQATVLNPAGSTLHAQIADLLNYWLSQGPVTLPTEFVVPYLSVVGFGGVLPSPNPNKNRTVFLNCYDGATLWSPGSTAYVQVVDTAAPNDSGVVRPIGNHEDPDHPTLNDHFDDEQPDVWVNGLANVAQGQTVDAMESGSLAQPLPTELDGDAAQPDFAYLPTISYYGTGWAGADPERALSIEVAGSPSTVAPGDTIDVVLSDIPDGWTRVLHIGVAKAFDQATFPPNVVLTSFDAFRFSPSTTGDATFTITIPPTYTGTSLTFQGWVVEPTTLELRSTGGMHVVVTQP